MRDFFFKFCFANHSGRMKTQKSNQPYSASFIGLVGRVFANGPGDLGSIPGCVIPKTLKMVHDT